MSLTQKELAKSGCGTPFCGHDHTVLHFHAACHRHSGVSVAYDKRTGELEITCSRCGRPVAKVEVAKGERETL